jgi:hypothetical protein
MAGQAHSVEENELHADCTKPKKVRDPLVYWAVGVGDAGFEPATSSVSGKRATTAPIAQLYCWR